ncbi:hypothetical protein [Pseudomonas sp. DE0157]|uniref:hypothetical protein n=1 Tax=Pseudomonas sp. DE0157 TaxID=2584952 RepID=UPI0011A63777|nr:hypothetical protein [Pseudomonas sp. DE0157]
MPTENRSSNIEMVSVPRDEVERLVKLLAYQAHPYPSPHAEYWQSVLDQPVQHQGEPVAVLYANGTVLTKADCGDVFDICCKVETPLYTHADPAEVDPVPECFCVEHGLHIEQLKAQLAEAHALLRKVRDGLLQWHHRSAAEEIELIDAALSTSAEPKCGKCHGRGLLRIATVCGPADKSCPECASADPSAPTHDPKLISIVHTPPAEYDEP